jgi:adenylylsulfate kinase-like enzyme
MARILMDQGLIVVMSLVAPDPAARAKARDLVGTDRFVEFECARVGTDAIVEGVLARVGGV